MHGDGNNIFRPKGGRVRRLSGDRSGDAKTLLWKILLDQPLIELMWPAENDEAENYVYAIALYDPSK